MKTARQTLKKMLAISAIIFYLTTLISPFNVNAEEISPLNTMEITYGDLRFNLETTTQTATVIGYRSGFTASNIVAGQPLEIPEIVHHQGVDFTVTRIAANALTGTLTTTLRPIVLPVSLTHIEARAFFGVNVITSPTGAREMNLSHLVNLRYIGAEAFSAAVGSNFGSPRLQLVLPPNLEYLGDWAFAADGGAGANNRFEGELIIPESVTYIGSFAYARADFSSIRHTAFFDSFEGLLSTPIELEFDEEYITNSFETSQSIKTNDLEVYKSVRWTSDTEAEIHIHYGSTAPAAKNFDIVIVMDYSNSMIRDRATATALNNQEYIYPRSILQEEIVMKAIEAFLVNNDSEGGNYDIRVALTTFASVSGRTSTPATSIHQRLFYTTFDERSDNAEAVLEQFLPLTRGGNTNYNAGLQDAIDIIQEREDTSRQPIVIFLSDGAPNPVANNGLQQAETLREMGVPVYPVAVFLDQGELDAGAQEALEAISFDSKTVFDGNSAENLEQVFIEIAENHMALLPSTTAIDVLGEQFEFNTSLEPTDNMYLQASAGIATSGQRENGQRYVSWDLTGAPAAKVHHLIIRVRLIENYWGEEGPFRTNDSLSIIRENELDEGLGHDESPTLTRPRLSYQFVSGTPGRELPLEVITRTPEQEGPFGTGLIVNASNNFVTTYMLADGSGQWQFVQWDGDIANGQRTIAPTNNIFTGTWIFVPAEENLPPACDCANEDCICEELMEDCDCSLEEHPHPNPPACDCADEDCVCEELMEDCDCSLEEHPHPNPPACDCADEDCVCEELMEDCDCGLEEHPHPNPPACDCADEDCVCEELMEDCDCGENLEEVNPESGSGAGNGNANSGGGNNNGSGDGNGNSHGSGSGGDGSNISGDSQTGNQGNDDGNNSDGSNRNNKFTPPPTGDQVAIGMFVTTALLSLVVIMSIRLIVNGKSGQKLVGNNKGKRNNR